VRTCHGTTDFYRPADEVRPRGRRGQPGPQPPDQAAANPDAGQTGGVQPAGVQPAGRAAREAFLDLVLPFLAVNAAHDREETEQRIARARDEVPELAGMVHKGERILDSHERITAEHVRKIASMAAYRREMEIGGRLGGGLLAAIGRLGAVALLVAAFLVYLRAVSRAGELRSLGLLVALGVLTLLATYVVVDHSASQAPGAGRMLPLLAAILLGRRVASSSPSWVRWCS
jgi:membrane-associated HD superfamily phosphohydrolase